MCRKCFNISVLAGGQHRDEDIHRDAASRYAVPDGCCLPRPIYLHTLAGLSLDVHRSFRDNGEFVVKLTELAVLIGNFSTVLTLVAVFVPQQSERHARFRQFLVDVLTVRCSCCCSLFFFRDKSLSAQWCSIANRAFLSFLFLS